MLASVGNFIASLPSWLSPTSTAAPSHGSPAEAPPPHQRTPLHATMRDPTTTKSALKRAAPVEDGLMPEQFYTLNPEFLTDTEKWTYRDLQVRAPRTAPAPLPWQSCSRTPAIANRSLTHFHHTVNRCQPLLGAAPGEAAGRAGWRQGLPQGARGASGRLQSVRKRAALACCPTCAADDDDGIMDLMAISLLRPCSACLACLAS
jgi:hypothetical protein